MVQRTPVKMWFVFFAGFLLLSTVTACAVAHPTAAVVSSPTAAGVQSSPTSSPQSDPTPGPTPLPIPTSSKKAAPTPQSRPWSIGLFSGDSPFHLGPAPGVTNPILTAGDVTDVKAEYVADPFLVIDDLQYYLFFEVLNHTDGQGDIGLAESMDGKTWRYRQVVLDEPFHLSYPYVFKWQGAYYMIPESAKDQSVRLYQAVDFPLRWKLVKKLLSGASFVDSSVVYFQDRWWMFTYVTGENALELYKADDLSGTWTAHPMSPLTRGNKHISRPAGRLLVWQNRLYRFAQDDAPLYGQQVFAFEVTKLTAADYQEIPVSDTPLVKSSDGAWAVTAMHQVDLHWMGESGWLVAVDGYIP